MKYIAISLVFILTFSCKQKQTKVEEKAIVSVAYKTELSAGNIERIEVFPSKYIASRTVDIWLPENYSATKKYAVLYMHDGQMLFDAETTWNKQEWNIDKTGGDLLAKGLLKHFIVVGIHSIASSRFFDLYPQKALNYIPKNTLEGIFSIAKENNVDMDLSKFNGDAYLKFLIQELKPYIDRTYAVQPDKENTFVMGSSMGGLMSMYAICEYPEVFSGAACLSTHWIGMKYDKVDTGSIATSFFDYIKDHMPDPNTHRIYFDFGTETLDQYYVEFEQEVNVLFKSKGYTNKNFENLKFEGADHTERSWQKRLDIPLTFLLKK